MKSNTPAPAPPHPIVVTSSVETAYFVLEGSPRGRSHRLSRVSQIVAINELLKPDIRNHARNQVSGLWPIEVHWLGKQAFRVLCLVGEDASQSALLKPHRDGNVMHDARIFLQRAGQEPPGEPQATCLIPQCDFVLPRNSSCCYTGKHADKPSVMNHAYRARMAGAIVDDALRTVSCRLFDVAKNPRNVFNGFWHDYDNGIRVLARTSYNDSRTLTLEWKARLQDTVLPMAHPPGPMRPQELDHDTAAREAETILSVSVKLDDLQRLFHVAGGGPLPGNIWAGGPSPAERKYFGMKDVAACGPWGKADTLFVDQPWRK